MKKLLILTIGIFLLFNISYSQDTSKLTVKQVYEDVKSGFTKFVSTLEGPAKHTYETYVKQHKIEGFSTFFLYLVPLCVSIVFTIVSFNKGTWHNGSPTNKWGTGQIICTFFVSVITLALMLSITTIFTKISNPEYYAIQDIIKAFK